MEPAPLEPDVLAALRAGLPDVARRTVHAVSAEVPNYAVSVGPAMGENTAQAVHAALDAFLRRVSRPESTGPSPGLDAAYALGRGEARSGRSIETLLAAYRVGARASWREMSTTLVERSVPVAAAAGLAGRVFDYIDELSATSVAGHSDELAKSGRVRDQYLEALGRALIAGEDATRLVRRAELAAWSPPTTLTVLIVPAARTRSCLASLDRGTLVLSSDAAPMLETEDVTVLLVPDRHRDRAALLDAVQNQSAVVGPAQPWTAAAVSYRRAVRAAGLIDRKPRASIDTDEHLVALVLGADPDALADLRARVLAPLDDLRPSSRERLEETLRSWISHQGRRDRVAHDLNVHAQTVRYRMNQIRDLYGDDFTPDDILELLIALSSDVGTQPEIAPKQT